MNKKQNLPYEPVYWVLVFLSSAIVSYSLISTYFWARPLSKTAFIIARSCMVIYFSRKYYFNRQ